jgi:hypothetical protein
MESRSRPVERSPLPGSLSTISTAGLAFSLFKNDLYDGCELACWPLITPLIYMNPSPTSYIPQLLLPSLIGLYSDLSVTNYFSYFSTFSYTFGAALQ